MFSSIQTRLLTGCYEDSQIDFEDLKPSQEASPVMTFLIPQDLPEGESRLLVLASLRELSNAAESVITTIETSVAETKDVISQLNNRVQQIEAKIQTLADSNLKGGKAMALSQHPQPADGHSMQLVFPLSAEPLGKARVQAVIGSALGGASNSSTVTGQDTKELYEFFKQLAVADPNSRQDASRAGLAKVEYVANLQQFKVGCEGETSVKGEGSRQKNLALSIVKGWPDTPQLPKNAHLVARSLLTPAPEEFSQPESAASLERSHGVETDEPLSGVDGEKEQALLNTISGSSRSQSYPQTQRFESQECLSQEHSGEQNTLSALGTRHSALQQSIMHRQHSLSPTLSLER